MKTKQEVGARPHVGTRVLLCAWSFAELSWNCQPCRTAAGQLAGGQPAAGQHGTCPGAPGGPDGGHAAHRPGGRHGRCGRRSGRQARPVPELLPPSTDTQGIHEPIGQQLSSTASAAAADSVGSGSAEEEAPLAIGAEDFEEALSNLRQRTAIAIGAPQACCSLLSPATVCAFQLACLLND